MAKPLFKQEDIYGRIIEFLYETAHKEYTYKQLCEYFIDAEKQEISKQLDNLKEEALISIRKELLGMHFTGHNNDYTGRPEMYEEMEDYYRISNAGYVFINDLKKEKKSDSFARYALYFGAGSLLISLYTLLEPTLFPYVPSNKVDLNAYPLLSDPPVDTSLKYPHPLLVEPDGTVQTDSAQVERSGQ